MQLDWSGSLITHPFLSRQTQFSDFIKKANIYCAWWLSWCWGEGSWVTVKVIGNGVWEGISKTDLTFCCSSVGETGSCLWGCKTEAASFSEAFSQVCNYTLSCSISPSLTANAFSIFHTGSGRAALKLSSYGQFAGCFSLPPVLGVLCWLEPDALCVAFSHGWGWWGQVESQYFQKLWMSWEGYAQCLPMKDLIFRFQTRIGKAGGDLSDLGPRLYKVRWQGSWPLIQSMPRQGKGFIFLFTYCTVCGMIFFFSLSGGEKWGWKTTKLAVCWEVFIGARLATSLIHQLSELRTLILIGPGCPDRKRT